MEHLAPRSPRGEQSPALPPSHAADLEEVGEVRLVANREPHAGGCASKVPDDDPLAVEPVAEDLGAGDVQAAVRQAPRPATQVRVGEVHRNPRVVPLRGRAQQQRPLAGDPQQQSGKVPGAVVVDPLLAVPLGADIPVLVEHRERIAALEDLVVKVHDLRSGLDLVANGVELVRLRRWS